MFPLQSLARLIPILCKEVGPQVPRQGRREACELCRNTSSLDSFDTMIKPQTRTQKLRQRLLRPGRVLTLPVQPDNEVLLDRIDGRITKRCSTPFCYPRLHTSLVSSESDFTSIVSTTDAKGSELYLALGRVWLWEFSYSMKDSSESQYGSLAPTPHLMPHTPSGPTFQENSKMFQGLRHPSYLGCERLINHGEQGEDVCPGPSLPFRLLSLKS